MILCLNSGSQRGKLAACLEDESVLDTVWSGGPQSGANAYSALRAVWRMQPAPHSVLRACKVEERQAWSVWIQVSASWGGIRLLPQNDTQVIPTPMAHF